MKSNKKLLFFCLIDIILVIFIVLILKIKILPKSHAEITNTNVTFTSYNGLFKITVPDSWKIAEQRGMLNEAADIELINNENLYYCVILMENKNDLAVSFNEYKNLSFELIEDSYQISIENSNIQKINSDKNNIYSYNFNTLLDDNDVNMNIYIFQTENYFGKCLIWYNVKNTNTNIDLNSIILSLQEV